MKINTGNLKKDILSPLFLAFEKASFRLLYVGGCVRNSILNAGTTDVDLATDATPQHMHKLAKEMDMRAISTGEAYGTLTFRLERHNFEITTFRKDIRTDGRRAVVQFGTSLKEDAARRDFTINALYSNSQGTLIDPLGIIEDVKKQRVCFIGDAQTRIKEDYLRILRFFRFHAWFGGLKNGIDAEGLAACAKLGSGISNVSKERIGSEFFKLLAASNPAPSLSAMENSGILKHILPGANARPLSLLVDLEKGLKPDALRRLALVGGDQMQENLRLSKAIIKKIKMLRHLAQSSELPQEHGYLLGAKAGWDSWLVRCALLEKIATEDEHKKIITSASKNLPVEAADFVDLFEGSALGAVLRSAQEIWISSNMQLNKSELITQVLVHNK